MIELQQARKMQRGYIARSGEFCYTVVWKRKEEEEMKKGNAALRLFLYASLISLVWLGGYVVLSDVFYVSETIPERPAEITPPAVSLPTPVSTQWSVLAVVDENRSVTDFLLRYADFIADTLVFVEIPVNTKAELTAGGYEVLRVHNPEVPALFMVSDLCRIFPEEIWCMAAEEAGVALLGIRPKECYIIEKTLYESMTETVEGQVRFRLPGSVKETIILTVEHAVTNDTLREELVYLESYLDIEHVYYRKLPGNAQAEEYLPDRQEVQYMVERLQMGFFDDGDKVQ